MISVICLSVAWLIVSSCSHVRYAFGFFITMCTLSGAILSNLGRSPRKYPASYNQIEIICSFMCAGFVLFAIGFCSACFSLLIWWPINFFCSGFYFCEFSLQTKLCTPSLFPPFVCTKKGRKYPPFLLFLGFSPVFVALLGFVRPYFGGVGAKPDTRQIHPWLT